MVPTAARPRAGHTVHNNTLNRPHYERRKQGNLGRPALVGARSDLHDLHGRKIVVVLSCRYSNQRAMRECVAQLRALWLSLR